MASPEVVVPNTSADLVVGHLPALVLLRTTPTTSPAIKERLTARASLITRVFENFKMYIFAVLKSALYDLTIVYLIYAFDLDTSAPLHAFLILRLALSTIGRVLLHLQAMDVRALALIIGLLLHLVGALIWAINCLVCLPN